jgi:hypothetical protein
MPSFLSRLVFLGCLGFLFPLKAATPMARPALIHDVRDYGARGDGIGLDSAAISRAIEAAAAAGGGSVVVPAGRYRCGTVTLRSHVTLRLEAGAVLIGSTELSDYPEAAPPIPTDTIEFRRLLPVYPTRFEYGRHSLIQAIGLENVAIEGRGVIDGSGDHPNFSKAELIRRGLTRQEAHSRRPYGLSFIQCRNVHVSGISFRNLAFWAQDYLDCEDVLVDGITVDSPALDRNNDGIDIDGSRRVRVVNSFFNTGDDAICLKASYRDCEDIVISNNVISSLVNGIKMGTASNGGFKNIAISNMVMRKVGAAGIALQIVDGGHMDGVAVNNVVMHEAGAAFFIRLGDRGRAWMRPEHHAVGSLKNVLINNVVAQIYTPWDGRPLGSSISGLPGHPVEDVTLSNIRIVSLREQPRDQTLGLGEAAIPENPHDYPEYSMFGSLPAYGLYARHVRELILDTVSTDFRTVDHRSSLFCDQVEDLRIVGWQVRTLPDSDPVIRLRDVRGADLVGLSAGVGTPVFLRLDGATSDVVLQGCDLSRAKEPLSFGPGVAPAVVRR